jgi:hypothetical protein
MQISGSAFNSGLNAIQAGQRRVDQAATEIASNTLPQAPVEIPPTQQLNPPPGSEANSQASLAESLVALNVGKTEAQAGAKVVETADEVLGTLIDTRV